VNLHGALRKLPKVDLREIRLHGTAQVPLDTGDVFMGPTHTGQRPLAKGRNFGSIAAVARSLCERIKTDQVVLMYSRIGIWA
jgi:hypothetical protein